MTLRSFTALCCRTALLTLVGSAITFGAVIYDSSGLVLTSSSPTQLGRLSRSGVPSDWSAQKAFPGLLNPAISYHYSTFVIPVSPFPYLQISVFDELGATNTFTSAYLNSYNPSVNLSTNYLGDAGSSGNLFGIYPISFQVTLPNAATNQLVLVVNDTSTIGAGIGQPFDLLVEGFYDTNFNDTTPTAPEPASFAFSGIGCLVAGFIYLRRRHSAA